MSHCLILPNHNVRKDGSCKRHSLCSTQGIKDGKIVEFVAGETLGPLTNLPGCKAHKSSYNKWEEVKRKMGKKKTAKREEKAIEKPAAEAEPKPEAAATAKLSFTDEQFLEALKQIGKPASSRKVSDKLGITDADKGRAIVRRAMEKLIEEKKVVAVEPEAQTRVGKLYKLA